MTSIRKLGAAAIATLIATAAFAGGHSSTPEEAAIKARNAHMSLYGFNLGPLGAMVKEEAPYDAAVAAALAGNLAALASIDTGAYWIEGTDMSVDGSRAKPEIWSDAEGFAAAEMAMTEAATALAAVAGNDLDALKASFGAVGQACGDCHKAYRGPRQ